MNILERQILEEGPRNAVVKLTGILDSSDISESPAISVSDFKNNETFPVGKLIGLRVDHLAYSIGDGIEIQLSWNGTFPQQMMPVAGRGKIDVTSDGGFVPDMTKPGYDGSINLITTGWNPSAAAQNFTILLRLVKLYGA